MLAPVLRRAGLWQPFAPRWAATVKWAGSANRNAAFASVRGCGGAASGIVGHFERFGLPHDNYAVDAAALKRRYQDLQREHHPDLVAAAAVASKLAPHAAVEAAAAESAMTNESSAVLSDPLRRAEYMLALHGQPITEGDGLAGAGEAESAGAGPDMGLLMEVMEWREDIEDVQEEVAEGQAGSNAKLAALVADFRARETQSIAAVAGAWATARAEGGADITETLALARAATIRLKYVRRAVEELEGLLPAA